MTFTMAGGPTGYAHVTVEGVEDPLAAHRHAEETAWEESRDDWGRPQVRGRDGVMRGYRRASSFGAPLESSFKLDAWKLRQVLRGATLDRSVRVRASRAMADLDSEVDDIAKAAKDELDTLAEEAMRVAGSAEKADIGTALHDVCERYDRGLPIGHVDEEWAPDVAEWQRLIADFDVLDVELIVANHEFGVAGRLDRVCRTRRPFVVRKARRRYTRGNVTRPAAPAIVLPAGTVIVVDQKTSQSMDFAGAKFGVQVMTYATGEPYDPITETFPGWDHEQPSAQWAAILHTPSGHGEGSIHWVDLRAAYGAAVDAHVCYEWRNKYGRRLIDSPEDDAMVLVAHASDRGELSALHERALRSADGVTDVLRKALNARWSELG